MSRIQMTESAYCHTQRAPLCLLLYALAVMLLAISWSIRDEPPIRWIFPSVALVVLVIAASFHYLRIKDAGNRLSIGFGPFPLFRRSVRYEDILSVEVGRTKIRDGWGIHLSLRGGWVWNLWGRDCVVLCLRKGTLRMGTDDAEGLAGFLKRKISQTAGE